MALAIHLLAVLLLAVAFGQSLSWALPARRLASSGSRGTTQRHHDVLIAPRFTRAGLLGDLGGILALLALLFVLPRGDTAFWLIAAALSLMLASQFLLWTVPSASGTAIPGQGGSRLARTGLALLGLVAVAVALGA